MKRNWVVITAIILAAGFVFYLIGSGSRQRRIKRLDKEIYKSLRECDISSKSSVIYKEYSVKKPIDIEKFKTELEESARRGKFELLRYEAKYEGAEYSYIFDIGTEEKTVYILKITGVKPIARSYPAAKKAIPEIAIVIDDWGYNMDNIKLLDSIDIPLTISILPSLPCSTKIAKIQHYQKNREIILHMPMEPKDQTIRLEKHTILVSMDRKQALSLLNLSFETVPYAKGLSSHMGSKATQDNKLMQAIMEQLKRKRLYFLDSLATPDSVCEQEAKRAGLRFAQRDIFLDNRNDKAYISSQVDKLIKVARKKGSAIGIGHDRRLTLEVIREKTTQLKYDDVKFVLVSQLAKN